MDCCTGGQWEAAVNRGQVSGGRGGRTGEIGVGEETLDDVLQKRM